MVSGVRMYQEAQEIGEGIRSQSRIRDLDRLLLQLQSGFWNTNCIELQILLYKYITHAQNLICFSSHQEFEENSKTL